RLDAMLRRQEPRSSAQLQPDQRLPGSRGSRLSVRARAAADGKATRSAVPAPRARSPLAAPAVPARRLSSGLSRPLRKLFHRSGLVEKDPQDLTAIGEVVFSSMPCPAALSDDDESARVRAARRDSIRGATVPAPGSQAQGDGGQRRRLLGVGNADEREQRGL